MRLAKDRIRHAILYETILLALFIPASSMLLHKSPDKIGIMGVSLSILAMVWNYIFNLGFDKTLRFMGRSLYPRGFKLRMLHAFLFEAGMIIATIPAMMWWLQIGIWPALVLDIGFLLIIPIYTYGYNWLYDQLFPIQPTFEKTNKI